MTIHEKDYRQMIDHSQVTLGLLLLSIRKEIMVESVKSYQLGYDRGYADALDMNKMLGNIAHTPKETQKP